MSTASRTIDVLLPELGESVTEGVVVEWRVAVGDRVSAGDVLLDVTTDKVDVEVPAPDAGVVVELIVQPGETIAVGARLAVIGPAGEEPVETAAPPAPAQAPPAAEPAGETAAAPAAEGDGASRTVPIVLPDMESVTEGTVVEWRVAPGDAVAADQIVVEISTDKVDLEVPSPAAGVLASIAFQAGETFAVGQPLGEIAVGAAAPAPAAEAAGDRDGDGASAEAPAPPAAAPAPQAPPLPSGSPAPAPPEWPAVSPLARREAIRRGIDLAAVTGSGPGGMVRQGDLAAASGNGGGDGAAGARPPEVPPVDGEREVTLRGPAKALAAYMDDSLSIPTATSFRAVNVGVLDAQRRAINATLTAVDGGKVSFTHLIAWAIVRAAAEITAMNTGYAVGEDGPERLEREFVNLGLAVDVERRDGSRSLLVPVVRGADKMDFAGFRVAFDDLVGRARTGGITPDELRGATVTLTNPGGIGTVASVPRLMLGQGTIVATGAIGYPPGLERTPAETLTTLGVDKVMNVTSTYDHRVIQGAESGEFLGRVAGLLAGDDDFYAQVRTGLGLPPETIIQPAPPIALTELAPTGAAAPVPTGPPLDDEELIEAVSGAMSVVKAHRTHGHLAAKLDPLGASPSGDPALQPETVGLTPESMARVPSSVLRIRVPGATFAEALPHLRRTYCGTLAFEIEHIAKHQKRVWLRERIESGWVVEPLTTVRRLELLERLIQVDAFERFLRRTYLGQKTFSVEGLDALVPMLDEIIEELADDGVSDVMIGMAHRGRLAVMCHTVGRPPESILAEFEGHMEFDADDDTLTVDDDPPDVAESAGDVKYHLGAEGSYVTRAARAITVRLAANPSHLEQVNAVVEGESRANQTVRNGRAARQDSNVAVPVLVHGDAAFTGQGVVAETLNLSSIDGYSTGGTIHIIANNQIGFTTDPQDSRSTRYASDPAKGYDIPIIHVNADDVDACMSAVKLAVAYRQRYGRDVVIDLVGYRRFGHNELDEPGYTQPVMARTIKEHPPVSRLYAQKLMAEGILTQERLDEVVAWAEKRMANAHASVRAQLEQGTFSEREDFESITNGTAVSQPVRTSVPEKALRSLNEQLLTVPDDFTLHPKLVPQLERRRTDLEESSITWAHAEALAFASLLTQGVPIRLTGQDAARGTFSQRHLELHDASESQEWSPLTGRTHIPMANLLRASAAFELYNSPLTEAAAVGFEYGYSVQAPEALVLWEAQYGDFANGAQIMIDQFIVSGSAKWGQRSRLTLLLPHGYEGNGPEHSSARIERFLHLAGDDNIRVAVPSTAGQYFHLLRKQALTRAMRPLVVFTPKSLLRHRGAASTLQHLTDGHFEPVLADPRVTDPARVRRLLLCTGKIFHDLDGHAERASLDHIAIGRVEMLYPFPEDSVRALVASYPDLEEVVWVQEEPRNMGAWGYIGRRIVEQLPEGLALAYAGRPRRATPSEGYPQAHQTEQQRLLAEALGLEVPV